ncbi:ABC transporter ATP-binding protein [Fructilactobacillus sanfranciscensis]|uniref:ABC transporter ATP-binding protein n=1 Tax=Fructilactobacillus sanfranciscensis TaxID=1625 RepID=UPI000CD3F47B|nr:ABC transporter ATP-binding protein [Fructilactobacillus sanfranciscensis]MCG7196283.1 ABC transporter ATP-binding protein [Fructilactobacillus sanfranciscensis]MVF15536.1 ABC transporter ATP-binding protein [Fructilactobacillus sanfranciscensis]POH11684.1 peptide ABC transporter ATP-binding protein [Fructilactobacillus sanfranciscensis]POH15352.1 peptide ABC transporter ATP-binding protein [Fructilactobacillus sanfranciscensis]POH17095.1 peptide ABC transporter ATP-binding protein [Fructil
METIKLTNINKSFGESQNKFKVLNNINFTANAGELIIITGPSGSGKSTLLTIMGALRNSDSGSVELMDTHVDQLKSKAKDQFRLNKLGFILQAHDLVPFLTVQEQFTLVNKVRPQGNMTQAQLAKLLSQLNLDSVVDHFPNELSGGQSQRVTIARGLYTKPDIILADEPTAALDSKRVTEVCQLLSDLAKKEQKTVIVVTHDDRVNQYADHIYNLVDGNLSLLK